MTAPPLQTTPATPGASDDQLMQENLPPLRGAYQRAAAIRVKTPREEAEQQLAAIQAGYAPWMGGTGVVNHRSGIAGFDSLTMLEAPFEISTMLGTAARLTVVSKPVFLDAGAATVSPILPGNVAERLGTALANAVLSQQNATGIGGEVQLATPTFAAAVGYSPYGFLVSNVIGRMNWKPMNGPFTITFARDSIRDSQLSYAGLRDPGSAGAGIPGNAWGGVVASGGDVQYSRGSTITGFYVSAGGQSIDGDHVQTNRRIDGSAGAYWRVRSIPDQTNVTVGVNFFGMHYAHNLTYFTYGH